MSRADKLNAAHAAARSAWRLGDSVRHEILMGRTHDFGQLRAGARAAARYAIGALDTVARVQGKEQAHRNLMSTFECRF